MYKRQSLEWIKHHQQTREEYTRQRETYLAQWMMRECERIEARVEALTSERSEQEIARLFPRKASGLCRGWCGIYDCPLNSGESKTQIVRPIRFKRR